MITKLENYGRFTDAAVESPAALRELVLEHLTTHPHVRHVETQLVFEVLEGAGMVPSGASRSM